MNSITQKTPKAEIGMAPLPITHHASRITQIAAPDWWTAAPKGERALLHAIARMLRGAKRSQLPEVARAAAKWERGIGCFVKVRLIREKQRESRKQKWRMGTDRDRSPVAATRTPVER
jgi:hypothetical protein